MCLTKIDVLDFLDTIKICVDYNYRDGSNDYAECMDLEAVEPKYIECKGWKTPLKTDQAATQATVSPAYSGAPPALRPCSR